MLSDDIINALQNMLSREYPDVKGMQDPVLGQALQFKVINESPFVQVLYTGFSIGYLSVHLAAILGKYALWTVCFTGDCHNKLSVKYVV